MKYTLQSKLGIFLASLAMVSLTACDNTKSYSDLLREEEVTVNWYLSENTVVPYVPEDSVFIVGKDAPFYRMDGDGNVYMRVINPGDMSDRPVKGQTVYMRFMRSNIKYIYEMGEYAPSEGNADDMNSSLNGMSIVYGNTNLTSTTQYGTGIQVPLDYLGYGCEVDLIVKSVVGASGDISQCNPYLYKGLRFYKAEY